MIRATGAETNGFTPAAAQCYGVFQEPQAPAEKPDEIETSESSDSQVRGARQTLLIISVGMDAPLDSCWKPAIAMINYHAQ